MGAFEHLKALCCLGLPAESAMVAAAPVLRKIVPHGWLRMGLLDSRAIFSSAYADNPAAFPFWCENFRHFMRDPGSVAALLLPAYRAVAIGWTLHRQGRDWVESSWYREIEAPLDSCWILDAMIGDGERSIAWLHLTRPRSARPFSVDEMQRLDPLRPWLAHALRRRQSRDELSEDQDFAAMAGVAVLSGEMILAPEAKVVFQTPGLEFLLRILGGKPGNYTLHVPMHEKLPSPIRVMLRRLGDSANGRFGEPPHMQIATAYGIVTLEAKWLMPANAIPADVAKDPKSCLVAVTIELREHAVAHAARVLRESGATPAQVKVGIGLALGKTKLAIAGELGLRPSTVEAQTKNLYRTLDIHNSAELGTKIWLRGKSDKTRQPREPGSAIMTNGAFFHRGRTSAGLR